MFVSSFTWCIMLHQINRPGYRLFSFFFSHMMHQHKNPSQSTKKKRKIGGLGAVAGAGDIECMGNLSPKCLLCDSARLEAACFNGQNMVGNEESFNDKTLMDFTSSALGSQNGLDSTLSCDHLSNRLSYSARENPNVRCKLKAGVTQRYFI